MTRCSQAWCSITRQSVIAIILFAFVVGSVLSACSPDLVYLQPWRNSILWIRPSHSQETERQTTKLFGGHKNFQRLCVCVCLGLYFIDCSFDSGSQWPTQDSSPVTIWLRKDSLSCSYFISCQHLFTRLHSLKLQTRCHHSRHPSCILYCGQEYRWWYGEYDLVISQCQSWCSQLNPAISSNQVSNTI